MTSKKKHPDALAAAIQAKYGKAEGKVA